MEDKIVDICVRAIIIIQLTINPLMLSISNK